MRRSKSLRPFVIPVLVAGAMCVIGCASHRSASATQNSATPVDSALYDSQVREEAAQLLRDNRGLTAKEAFAAAREKVAARQGSVGPTRTEREQAEAQDKFESDLNKLGK